VRFWTKTKTVTQRWPDGSVTGENAFVIPTMGWGPARHSGEGRDDGCGRLG